MLIYVVCMTTILSGLDYVWIWGARAYRNRHHQEHPHK
jgi:hypothetical protein